MHAGDASVKRKESTRSYRPISKPVGSKRKERREARPLSLHSLRGKGRWEETNIDLLSTLEKNNSGSVTAYRAGNSGINPVQWGAGSGEKGVKSVWVF